MSELAGIWQAIHAKSIGYRLPRTERGARYTGEGGTPHVQPTTEELQKELKKGGVQLLDIRERQKLGWIPGSLHVPRRAAGAPCSPLMCSA